MPLLWHLNLSRERFKDFDLTLVFLMPRFALRYMIHRAPDYFDWHSGEFEFVMDEERLQSESSRIWMESDYKKYCLLSPQERQEKTLSIQSLLEEIGIAESEKARLLFEQGNLFAAGESYEGAIAAYDAAFAIKPDKHEALNNKGIVLSKLDRNEEAIAAYDAALAIKPNYESAIYNKACLYGLQGDTESTLNFLKLAIELESENREIAKTDADFDSIRDNERFQQLINA